MVRQCPKCDTDLELFTSNDINGYICPNCDFSVCFGPQIVAEHTCEHNVAYCGGDYKPFRLDGDGAYWGLPVENWADDLVESGKLKANHNYKMKIQVQIIDEGE